MPTLNDDKKLELLNDHYKDTFVYLKETLRLRDRLFVFILVTITLLLFQLYSPSEAGTTIGAFIAKQLDVQNAVSIAFVGSVIWFALLAFVMRYFQTVIFIEIQYNYIHNVENQLSVHYDHKAFTREELLQSPLEERQKLAVYFKDYGKNNLSINKVVSFGPEDLEE